MNVLFVCTANSCRSQMAEAWAHQLFPRSWRAQSAGLLTYRITENTRRTMAEVGINMAGQESKSIDAVDLDAFDLIVTLSEEAGRFLPGSVGPERHIHHPLDDPMEATGTPEEIAQEFRQARDRIRALVQRIAGSQILIKPEENR